MLHFHLLLLSHFVNTVELMFIV